MSDTKLSLEAALQQAAVKQHNSAINNAVSVIESIAETRRQLNARLATCDEDEAYVRELAALAEADPVRVNDDEKLFKLHNKYSMARGPDSLHR